MKAVFLFSLFTLSSCFDFPTDDSVCKFNQQCKLPEDCPQVVKDFKEKKIQPTICNFRPLSVCCADSAKTTNPIKTLSCGKKNTERVFPFQLGRRKRAVVVVEGDIFSIVGGNDVVQNSYPWMAALGSRTEDGGIRWFCGGSLISSNMILTAAHCIEETGSELFLDIVRLGAHNLGESSFGYVDDYAPKQVIILPEYKDDGSFPEHDIAIIVLQTEGMTGVILREEVSPVCLPAPKSQLPAGSPVLVAGWGATSEGGLEADILQEVTVEVTEQIRCRAIYKQLVGAEIGEDILCAGLEEGGKDACQGDSGGPLVFEEDDGTFHLVGVVSAGLGCARRDVLGIYAKVSNHVGWIEYVRSRFEQF